MERKRYGQLNLTERIELYRKIFGTIPIDNQSRIKMHRQGRIYSANYLKTKEEPLSSIMAKSLGITRTLRGIHLIFPHKNAMDFTVYFFNIPFFY